MFLVQAQENLLDVRSFIQPESYKGTNDFLDGSFVDLLSASMAVDDPEDGTDKF